MVFEGKDKVDGFVGCFRHEMGVNGARSEVELVRLVHLRRLNWDFKVIFILRSFLQLVTELSALWFTAIR